MQISKAKTVDAYLAEAAPKQRAMMKQLRALITKGAPEAAESISYRMPFYRYKGMFLGFAAADEHIGLYAVSQAIIKRHAKQLAGYTVGKGSIQLPLSKRLPATLLRSIIRERVAEMDARASRGKR